MSKPFEGNLSLKFFAIALAVMMAASVLPAALAGQPVDCEHEDCHECEHAHECADMHSHETCACHHGHEACACGHPHDDAEHDHVAETLTAMAYPGEGIFSAPSPTKPSGFPVWLDAHNENTDGAQQCGFEPDTSCAYCSGTGSNDCPSCDFGTVTCWDCGGSMLCSICLGSGDCGSCGGSGGTTCTVCGGDGMIDGACTTCGGDGDVGVECTACSASGNCATCGGTGDDGDGYCDACSGSGACPICGGTGGYVMCTDCMGTGEGPCTNFNCVGGLETCMTCWGSGDCQTCIGSGVCQTCSGAGGWPCTEPGCDGGFIDCTVCGADGLIDLDHQLAQEFVPATAGQVAKVRVMISNPNSFVSDIRFYLCDNLTTISDVVSISGDEVGAAPQWLDVEFHDSVALTAGVSYYIVAEADEYPWYWHRDMMDSYPGGSAWSATDDMNWASLGSIDMDFQVYLTTVHNKIYTLQELQDIDLNLTGNYELMNDIDASATATWNGGLGFDPIGDIWSGSYFKGLFEGGGHTIRGLYINRQNEDNIGMFSGLNIGAMVNDTHLSDATIIGREGVGGLAGRSDAKVGNCSVSGSIAGTNWVGGLIGYSVTQNIDINHSHACCDVSGDNWVGGLIGTFSGMFSNMSYCSSSGTVAGYDYVGGLAGSTDHPQAVVKQCYSTADVTGNSTVGGFSGFNYLAIRDCYATGDVNAVDRVGSMVGWCDGLVDSSYATGHVTGTTNTDSFIGYKLLGSTGNCYYDRETTGFWTSTVYFADPQTTAALLTQSTYSIAWDFANVWWMVDGQTRPFLRMEFSEEISNSHQLQMMAMDLNADYTLENDIDLSDITEPSQMWGTSLASGKGWWPIGTEAIPFAGSLDGQGHEISCLFINRPVDNDVGMFNFMEGAGPVKNIRLTGVNVTGYYPVGGLAAHARESQISHVAVSGTVTSTDEEVGGLVGWVSGSTARIDNCSMSGTVSGNTYYIGGLVGYNAQNSVICHSWSSADVSGGEVGGFIGGNAGVIYECYSTGNVLGGNNNISYTGGFAAYVSSFTNMRDCYARGNVSGYRYVGGFTGSFQAAVTTVSNCYSTGAVTGTLDVGGFTAQVAAGASATDCFWDTETSGQSTSAGGTPKTTAEMMQQATFGGWDFANIWGIVENQDYPVLKALCQADLEVDLVPNNPFANVEPNALTYTMYVTNHGPDPAFDVTLSLLIPAHMSPSTGNPLWDSFDAGYVNYSLGTIASGQTLNPYLIVDIDAYAPVLTSHASVSSSVGDPGEYPNQDSETISVNRHPVASDDSTVTKADEMLAVPAPGVLVNDNDPDADALTVASHDTASTYGAPVTVNPNGSYTYDPLGSSLMVALGNGDSLDDFFNYTVTDGASGWDTAMVTVTVTGVNDPPAITTAEVTTSTLGVPYSVDYNANDPDDGDVLAWALATNATWLSINATTGVLSGTPTAIGTFWVNASVSDTFPASDWSNFTLAVTDPNSPPIISTANAASAYVGTLYSVNYDATDTDGDALTWALDTDASWLSIDVDGVLSGTPALANVGTFLVNVSVSDGNGGSDFTEFTLTVINNNQAPAITTADVLTAKVGVLYSVDYNATDADGDTLAWARQTNATWLSINAATGILSGTPTAAGTFWVNVTVDDGNGGLAWRHFDIAVSPADPVDDDDDDDDDDVEEETVDAVIGPLLDANGDPISGALVTVTIGNATYTGMTGADGNVIVTLPETALGAELGVVITKDGYSTIVYTVTLALDGTVDEQPPVMEYSDLGPDDQRYDYTWMFIVLVLVIVIIIGAVWWLRPKAPKPEKFDPQPAEPEEEPPNFNSTPSDANKVEPKENIAEDGATTYVETQTPYDRLG